MTRIAFLLGLAGIVAFGVMVVQQALQNPIEAKQQEFESRLQEAQRLEPERQQDTEDISFSGLVDEITKRGDLWRALIELPPPQEEPPDWNEILKGVRFTRQTIGSPPDIQIRTHTSASDQVGQWASVGTVIRGARITEITDSHVVFSTTKDGKEYTRRVPR